MATVKTPKVGEFYDFTTYAAVDYCTRPSKQEGVPCNWTCWLCHGDNTGRAQVVYREKVAEVLFFMDNSIELVSVTGRRATFVAPHGDVC